MNQKDHKEIARIIKERELFNSKEVMDRHLAHELADYFEREEKQANDEVFKEHSYLIELDFN